jgi:uncharacterized protein YlzI (FlbEa/FlbD family)
MIRLFRHDGLEFMLTIDMIKEIDAGPPTAITLLNGETIRVKNTIIDIETKISAYREGIQAENQDDDPEPRKYHRGRKIPQ